MALAAAATLPSASRTFHVLCLVKASALLSAPMSQSWNHEQSRSPRLKDTKLHRAHAMQEAMQACRCHSVDRVLTSAGHGNEPLLSRKHSPELYSVVAQYPSIHPSLDVSFCIFISLCRSTKHVFLCL